MVYRGSKYSRGFTIVELLIVIVVIGILAAITIVAYNGIQQRATVASLNSDLDNASKTIKLFQVDNSAFPATINCAIPDSTTNKCVKSSNGTTYQYIATSVPQLFCLAATKSAQSYSINQDGTPLAGSCPILRLDAGNTMSYPGTGTTWTDLSGSASNGTLMNGVGYSSANGGALTFDGVISKVALTSGIPVGRALSIDVVGKVTSTAVSNNFFSANGPAFIRIVGGKVRWDLLTVRDSDGVWTWSFNNGNISILPNVIYDLTMTFDGSSVKGYVNGVQDINIAVATGQTPPSAYITIGYTTGGEDSPLIGSVYTVKLYDKTLSDSDITQNFNSIRGRYGL